LDVIQQSELIEYERDVLGVTWWPDMAAPGNIKTLKRMGHSLNAWKKGPGSVLEGIESVRVALRPVDGKISLFYLKDDEGCESAFKRLNSYKWKVGSNGLPTEVPDDFEDDQMDCQRYLIMNELRNRRQFSLIPDQPKSDQNKAPNQSNYLTSLIDEALGGTPRVSPNTLNSTYEKDEKSDENQQKIIKKRNFRMI
jgi:hypothetical protein